MSHALRRPNFKPYGNGPGTEVMRRENFVKVVNGRAIVCPLGDEHRESGQNRRFSAGIHAPESLSRALEHKMHGQLPAKGLRMRRSERHQGRLGADLPKSVASVGCVL